MGPRSIIIFIFLSLPIIGYGQRLGIKGGPDILGANYSYNGQSKDSNPQMGFHLGMAIEFKLSDNFALGSGVLFSEKGFQEDYQIPDKDKTTFFYIDIPALFIYKAYTGRNNLYFQAGPYLGLGLFTNLTGPSFDIEEGFGTEPGQYKKYDFGLSFGGGIEFDIWRLGLCYTIGIVDIRNATDTSVRNMVLGVDVAYMFGHRNNSQ